MDIKATGVMGGLAGHTFNSQIEKNNIIANITYSAVEQAKLNYTCSGKSYTTTYKVAVGGFIGINVNSSMYNNVIGGKLMKGDVNDNIFAGRFVGSFILLD